MVSPILIPENQRQPFPRDVGKVSGTKDKWHRVFLLRDEHAQDKLAVMVVVSWNWPPLLHGKRSERSSQDRNFSNHFYKEEKRLGK